MSVSNVSGGDYLNMVQRATRLNTVNEVANARQSGQAPDMEQLQASNQQVRDTARETGVALYSQNLAKQTVETYTKTTEQMNSSSATTTTSAASSSTTENGVYTFDSAAVNDALQTTQKRALGVALYENLNDQATQRPEFSRPDNGPVVLPVNVYV